MNEWGWIGIFALSIFAVGYLAVSMLMDTRKGGGRMGGGGRRYSEKVEFLETISPFVEGLKGPSGLMLSAMSSKDIKELQGKIADAGLTSDISLVDFIGMRLVGAIGGALVGVLMMMAGLSPMFSLLAIMLFALIGWVAPVSWLNGAAEERQRKIFRGLSDTLDVLAVSVDAGLELREGLRRVVDIGGEPELDREISRTLEEIDKGGKSLRQGFEDLRERVSLPEMTAFCNVVLMAFQIGAAGMGPILIEQAESIRRERVLRAERQANQMGSKILFPIAVFIFPAVIVTLLGPMSLEAYLQFGA